MEERKQVVDEYIPLSIGWGKLSDAIERIQTLMEKHGDLDISHGYIGYNDREEPYITTMRPETDSEMEERLGYETEREQRQYRDYLLLKKKFEGVDK